MLKCSIYSKRKKKRQKIKGLFLSWDEQGQLCSLQWPHYGNEGFGSDKIKHRKKALIFFSSRSIITSFLSPFFQNSAEEERKMDESLQSCKYLASLTE